MAERTPDIEAKLTGGTHDAGCVYGGFSCGFWMIADGCPEEHWEEHYAKDDVCPCGDTFPGAGTARVLCDATAQEEDAT